VPRAKLALFVRVDCPHLDLGNLQFPERQRTEQIVRIAESRVNQPQIELLARCARDRGVSALAVRNFLTDGQRRHARQDLADCSARERDRASRF